MPRWKRDDETEAMAVAAGVPDAVAIRGSNGNLIGWDESEANAYLARHGMLPCDTNTSIVTR